MTTSDVGECPLDEPGAATPRKLRSPIRLVGEFVAPADKLGSDDKRRRFEIVTVVAGGSAHLVPRSVDGGVEQKMGGVTIVNVRRS